jgi:hypothetical protein
MVKPNNKMRYELQNMAGTGVEGGFTQSMLVPTRDTYLQDFVFGFACGMHCSMKSL